MLSYTCTWQLQLLGLCMAVFATCRVGLRAAGHGSCAKA